ncbi:globin domain-containing protein [Sphingomonas oryzagri]|uniref:Globin n=1 Tax=Sphingomonas oryzagri TaxID=3042314 RepID=A0ABT6N5Q2_9SPHN|nr:globin [Sphingomonas oryzagri]MDH7640436.1 globin [Sphingomonas oryzagri]
MTPFQRIGGIEVVRALSDDFYDRIEAEPRFAELRALHADMQGVRAAFATWLSAWLGGPPLPPDPRGCIMSRHRAMGFGRVPAAQWIAAMERSLALHIEDAELRASMLAAFGRMAAAMLV